MEYFYQKKVILKPAKRFFKTSGVLLSKTSIENTIDTNCLFLPTENSQFQYKSDINPYTNPFMNDEWWLMTDEWWMLTDAAQGAMPLGAPGSMPLGAPGSMPRDCVHI